MTAGPTATTRLLARLALVAMVVHLAVLPVFPGSKESVEAVLAQTEVPARALLDVGIEIFNPGLPEDDENALEEEGVFPEVRKSEARFIPFHLKNSLEGTGLWGAVRVVPQGTESVDVHVAGEILRSNGLFLVLRIRVNDSTGREWFERRYKKEADPMAYEEDMIEVRDPYQSLYNEIANDMLEVLEKLDEEELETIREITGLRFAASFAPWAQDYLKVSRNGRYRIERLPAEGDTMMARLLPIRERDEMFVDTLNEYYSGFYARMGEAYDDWRQFSWEEEVALREIRRKARKQKILAGLLIFGAAVASPTSAVQSAARDAAVIGGAIALQAGIQTGKEAKIHREALKELAASFDSEIAPVLVEVEGQTLRLEGSAESQYSEWRRLLAQMFATETGLDVDPNATEESEQD